MEQISKSQSARNATNGIVYRARTIMINCGKFIPFAFCAIVAISYAECLKAMITCDYLEFSDGVYLNKPISFFIGKIFELNLPTLLFVAIISISIKTCKWNKLAILYLAFQLYEKSYFANHQFENTNLYYVVIIINLSLCTFFVIKGLQRLKNTKTK